MKYVRFTCSSQPGGAYGLVGDDGRIEVLRGGLLDPVERTGEIIRNGDILRYLPPVDPPNVFAIGRNYVEHAAETRAEVPSKPLVFMKATTAVRAHQDEIVLPKAAPSEVDYEAELAVIIGRQSRNVPVEDALSYVFGYTCANDVSARDCQRNDGQWTRAKSFDTFAPVGPYVVTDLDPTDIRIRMRLNQEIMQDQSTKAMVFAVPYLVSYLSHGLTLLPGTIILTGTPSGVGVGRKPPVFLKPGDVCEVEVEGIGVLRNTVVAGEAG